MNTKGCFTFFKVLFSRKKSSKVDKSVQVDPLGAPALGDHSIKKMERPANIAWPPISKESFKNTPRSLPIVGSNQSFIEYDDSCSEVSSESLSSPTEDLMQVHVGHSWDGPLPGSEPQTRRISNDLMRQHYSDDFGNGRYDRRGAILNEQDGSSYTSSIGQEVRWSLPQAIASMESLDLQEEDEKSVSTITSRSSR